MAGLRLAGLKKTYGKDVHILKGIDFEIKDGEFLVLVGPSGCGKSTLLRCIAGLEEITGGDLYINDNLVNKLPPKARDVAMVFQSYALYPHMTVRQNMGFSLKIRKKPKDQIEKEVNEAARMLELDKLLDRLPKELSGGQRQRVAIGRAIVRRPSIFLFDEPLSNLDANLRGVMRLELKKLHQKLGVTMVYVTHDQIEAMTLADRICVLEGGWARQVDTPLNLYERPNSKFIAEFIGSPPMNFFNLTPDDNKLLGDGINIPMLGDIAGLDLPDNVDVGIRPHQMALVDDDVENNKPTGVIEVDLDVVETVGWDLHLHCHTMTNTPVIAQVEAETARNLSPNSRISLVVDPLKIKIFDPGSEKTIWPEA